MVEADDWGAGENIAEEVAELNRIAAEQDLVDGWDGIGKRPYVFKREDVYILREQAGEDFGNRFIAPLFNPDLDDIDPERISFHLRMYGLESTLQKDPQK